jgi:hypothetical protein
MCGNAPDAQVSITRVVMEPGAISPRHSHPRSEQTWIVESGSATLLLAGGACSSTMLSRLSRMPTPFDRRGECTRCRIQTYDNESHRVAGLGGQLLRTASCVQRRPFSVTGD